MHYRSRSPKLALLSIAWLTIAWLTIAASARAQHRRTTPCMPYGSFADELRARGIGVYPQSPPAQKIRIAKVGFRGVTQLPDSELKKFVSSLKSKEFDDDGRLIEVIEGYEVRAFWQDRGYFRVRVKVDVQPYGEPAKREVAVGISVEEGLQYRLREVRFASTDEKPLVFPIDRLRAQIPLRDGEIFKVDQIRKGLDELKRLYAEEGYIDFTSEPRTDEFETAEVTLTLRLDQQRQFRISRISVIGLSAERQAQLKWRLREGDVFQNSAFEAFFEDNKSLLPAGADEGRVEIRRNLNEGTLALIYNFAGCPLT